MYKNFCKIIDVYMYNELYKRGIIKSRSFTFSNSLQDVRSKLMYITKSLAINLVNEHHLEKSFTKISFDRDTLILDFSLNRNDLSGYIIYQLIKVYFENQNDSITNITYSNMSFVMRDIERMFGDYNYNSTVKINIKESINEVINSILFIQASILTVGAIISSIKELPETQLMSLKYCQYLTYSLIGNRRTLAKTQIGYLQSLPNADELFATQVILDLNDSYNWNKTVAEFITKLFHENYVAPSDNEVVTETPLVHAIDPAQDARFIVINGMRVALND